VTPCVRCCWTSRARPCGWRKSRRLSPQPERSDQGRGVRACVAPICTSGTVDLTGAARPAVLGTRSSGRWPGPVQRPADSLEAPASGFPGWHATLTGAASAARGVRTCAPRRASPATSLGGFAEYCVADEAYAVGEIAPNTDAASAGPLLVAASSAPCPPQGGRSPPPRTLRLWRGGAHRRAAGPHEGPSLFAFTARATSVAQEFAPEPRGEWGGRSTIAPPSARCRHHLRPGPARSCPLR